MLEKKGKRRKVKGKLSPFALFHTPCYSMIFQYNKPTFENYGETHALLHLATL